MKAREWISIASKAFLQASKHFRRTIFLLPLLGLLADKRLGVIWAFVLGALGGLVQAFFEKYDERYAALKAEAAKKPRTNQDYPPNDQRDEVPSRVGSPGQTLKIWGVASRKAARTLLRSAFFALLSLLTLWLLESLIVVIRENWF